MAKQTIDEGLGYARIVWRWLAALVLIVGGNAVAVDNTSTPSGKSETVAAVRRVGDKKSGGAIYDVCVDCHRPSGAGRPDGSIPQLAGQHSTVLLKQLADIRAGVRENPAMYPFASTLTDPQELADLAAYVESLCIPADHGRYEGRDASRQVAMGKALYDQACRTCHGARGEGDKDKLQPVLAGQHYPYLLRQMIAIRDGRRGNSHAGMVNAIKSYSDEQLLAIAAYQASLTTPGTACRVRSPLPKKRATLPML